MAKIKIAVTGGIGSGKSVALSCIREMGYPVYSCDEIYKQVILSEEYIKKIQTLFPSAVVQGKINREILSEIVFNNADKLQKLNNAAHPLIMKSLLQQMEECDAEIVVAEVPLLFEGNFENLFDKIIYIRRNLEKRLQNVSQRDTISIEEIKKRIASQFDPNTDIGKARLKNCNPFVIENEGTIENLKNKLKQILFQILKT